MESINIMPEMFANVGCFLVGIATGAFIVFLHYEEKLEQKRTAKINAERDKREWAKIEQWAADLGRLPE